MVSATIVSVKNVLCMFFSCGTIHHASGLVVQEAGLGGDEVDGDSAELLDNAGIEANQSERGDDGSFWGMRHGLGLLIPFPGPLSAVGFRGCGF